MAPTNTGGGYALDALDAKATAIRNLSAPAPSAMDFGYHVVGLYPPAAARAKVPARPRIHRLGGRVDATVNRERHS